MKRLLQKRLDEWRIKNDGKVLILQGARQTGKTSCVLHFASQYNQYIHLDLSDEKERQIFNKKISADELLRAVFFLKDKRIEQNSLLFLDGLGEGQEVWNWLPLLAKNRNGVQVIASSACQVGLLYNSFADILTLRPYNFIEFLQAMGEESALEALNEIPFPNVSFDKLIRFFHLYTLIGGMPEVVENYSRHQELLDLRHVYEKIHAAFIQEIRESAASEKGFSRTRELLQNAFPFASHRISFRNFGSSETGSREAAKSFRDLEKLMILKMLYPVTSALQPLAADKKKSPRLQLMDSGLVNYFSGIQKQIFEADDLVRLFDGQIIRNVTGQEILASGSLQDNDLHFWVRDKHQSSAEVDFIIPYREHIIPVVLKNGEPGRLRSLHQFMDEAPHPFAVRLWAHPLSIQQAKTIKGKKFFLMSLPYFLAGKIPDHLEGFIKLVGS